MKTGAVFNFLVSLWNPTFHIGLLCTITIQGDNSSLPATSYDVFDCYPWDAVLSRN